MVESIAEVTCFFSVSPILSFAFRVQLDIRGEVEVLDWSDFIVGKFPSLSPGGVEILLGTPVGCLPSLLSTNPAGCEVFLGRLQCRAIDFPTSVKLSLKNLLSNNQLTPPVVFPFNKLSIVLLAFLLDLKVAHHLTISELSLMDDIFCKIDLHSQSVALAIEELTEIDHSTIVVDYAFINLVAADGLSKVYAVLVLFNFWFREGEVE